MQTITVTTERAAHGGKAFGKMGNKPVFVAGALPGEKVRARVIKQGKVLEAVLESVIKPSADRIAGRCEPSDIAIADMQHAKYAAQLALKEAVVRDQFWRVGKFESIPLAPIRPNPTPWQYRRETVLSPTKDGRLGYWSPSAQAVVPARACAVLTPALQVVLNMIDFELEDLIKLRVRVGNDGEGQLVFAMRDAEPPQISADIPVSVALVMPDGVSATLFGDPFLDQTIDGHDFRVGAGCHFQPSLASAELLSDAVIELARLTGSERVLDCFSGVGMLTRRLAANSAEVIGIERNPDAIEDAAVNLDDTDNVALYDAWAENALPAIDMPADLIVLDSDGNKLTDDLGNGLMARQPKRIVYSSPNLASAAQDARIFASYDYRLEAVQAIDMLPQTHQVHTVTAWRRK